MLNGVVYEPNGAHIFHTSNPRVAAFVKDLGLSRPYQHRVLTSVYLDEDDEEPHLLSWPPQLSELRQLPLWRTVQKELKRLPPEPSGDDFESYVISMMGETLYRIFIREYTIKQWGCDPVTLSSSFAPRRVELRDDGYTRLFRDRWEYFAPRGFNEYISRLVREVPVMCGTHMGLSDLHTMVKSIDGLVITGALDDFTGRPGDLEWRGIRMQSRYTPAGVDETSTPNYVVNHASLRVPYTRTVETKHATGQKVFGTVVSEEYPGAPERHYPVPTVDSRNEKRNAELQHEIRSALPIPVWFCGRLATYRYINQDQAILDGIDCATRILRGTNDG